MFRHSTAALMLAAPLAVLAAPQSYSIDPVHSFPNFAISHFGMSVIHGRFDRMSGKIVLDTAARGTVTDVWAFPCLRHRPQPSSTRAQTRRS